MERITRPPIPGPPELQQFVDAQERRYDPSAWLGGDIHPVYKSPQSKRVGVLLLIQAVIVLVFVAFTIQSRDVLPTVLFSALAVLLLVGATRKLRQKPEPVPGRDGE